VTILEPGTGPAPTQPPTAASAKAKGVKGTKAAYVCNDCGAQQPKWSGQCPVCQAWNSIAEELVDTAPVVRAAPSMAPLGLLADVDAVDATVRPTGIGELDRVLGGGLVPGSVTVLGGEPGIGKSTLVMQLAGRWDGPTLYVSGEESPRQVRHRADRLLDDGGGWVDRMWIASETSLRGVIDAIERVGPQLVVIDSIQTLVDDRVAASPGSPTQVRECAQQLVVEAKRRGVAMLLVGHVTKEGTLAGPRVLEHVVDTVLAFEGERHHALRLLRAVKHRFGATGELGLFEMTGEGLTDVPDPSHLFLTDRRPGVAGSVIVPAIDGHRPLLVEIQALTVPVPAGTPTRRNTQGLDSGRLAMLLAVIDRRVGLRTSDQDVYASTVGGVKINEPGTDLGVALAVASSILDVPLPRDLVAVGEVGLGGEVRQVPQMARRLAEAARLGYRRALVPATAPEVDGIRSVPADSVGDVVGRVMASGNRT